MSVPGAPEDVGTPEDVGRWRTALAELAAASGPQDDCPDPESLWQVASGELEPLAAREVVEHLAGCAHCGEALRLAQELRRQAAVSDREEERTRSTGARRWLRPGPASLAVAAAVLAVVLGGLWFFQRSDPRAGAELREPAQRALLSLLDEDAALPRDNFLLRWSPGEEGTIYSVLVSDEELEVVSRAELLEDAEYMVPEEDLVSLQDGAVVLWRVSSRQLDGGQSSSATFVNRLD